MSFGKNQMQKNYNIMFPSIVYNCFYDYGWLDSSGSTIKPTVKRCQTASVFVLYVYCNLTSKLVITGSVVFL